MSNRRQFPRCVIEYPFMKKVLNYFKHVWMELKKVSWPSFPKAREMTFLVVGVTIIWGVFVWLLDTGFGWLMSQIIMKR